MPAGAQPERQTALRPRDVPARLGENAQWDPNLPIRGRYLALRLAPAKDAQWYTETNGQMVLFFVPEHTLPFEVTRSRRDAPELWAEVTLPHRGPPRPIRLAIKKEGKMELLDIK
jgi:hypothetical protein